MFLPEVRGFVFVTQDGLHLNETIASNEHMDRKELTVKDLLVM
jgi:hypothetical protein